MRNANRRRLVYGRSRTAFAFLLVLVALHARGSVAVEVVSAGQNNPAYKAELYRPAANATLSPKKPLLLRLGPHSFIDDYLIDRATNVRRR